MSLWDDLNSEMVSIKGFHSVSPQYNFYSSRFVDKLDKLIYNNKIDKDSYKYLHKELFTQNDLSSIHSFTGIDELFKKYRPKLGELDLLYSLDLSTIKMLRDLSYGICNKLNGWNVFCPELPDRINYLISNIHKCSDTLSLSNREVYYHISILKSALLMSGKIHPNKYLKDLCDVYSDLYRKAINDDLDFYREFQDSFNTDQDKSILKISSSFIESPSKYDYHDYLIDYNDVVCGLSCNESVEDKINSINDSIYNSYIPSTLKDNCSNDLFRLRTNFIDNIVSISAPYYWYNAVQDSFVYHCTPLELEEGYDVGSCICQMTTFEGLVEYAVQSAALISLANDRNKDSFNEGLYDVLFKLYTNGMMDNYIEVYEQFKQ